MRIRRFFFFLPAFLFIALALLAAPQERDRNKIPDQHKWNLADLYPDLSAWSGAKERLAAEIPRIGAFQGKLGSAGALAEALDLIYRIEKDLRRISVYAGLLANQDTRLPEPQGMVQQMQQLAASFAAAGAYVEPEILKA